MNKLELFLPFPLSTISQYFNGNANPLYAGQGLKGHTAIDWGVPWGTPVPNCAANAYCYSVMHKDNPDPTQYRAVFTLVEDDNGIYEISYGHASTIFAQVGVTYQVGDILMDVGNTGDVYSAGIAVTKGDRLNGSRAGAHLHGPQVRPVKRVSEVSSNKQYLYDGSGLFQKDGFYYEIVDYGNGYNGCVNPFPFLNGQLANSLPTVLPSNTSVSYETALANLQKAGLPYLIRIAAEAILRVKYGR